MPDAGKRKPTRHAAAGALEVEQLYFSLSGHPRAALPALLRRCFQFLPYLDHCGKDLADWCRLCLLDSLRAILSFDPSPSLLPAIEVFVENLVFNYSLRKFFVEMDSAAPEGSRVAPRFHVQYRTDLELACNHFISSLEDEGGFQAFLSALSWSGNKLQRAPEISSYEAFGLLNITRLFSLPRVVEAHLLLLMSRCVSVPDLGLHLSAFERFMNLYVDCLQALGVFKRTGGVKALAEKKPLTCCIKEVTHQKLKSLVNGLLSFCQAHVGDNLPISDSDIHDVSDRLIEENQHMLHEKFRQEVTTVTSSLLSKAIHCAKQKEVHEYDAAIIQDVIFLAAVLRLMGSLLVQILHHFSQMRSVDGQENANHVALRGNYSILCDTIRLLSNCEANELHSCDFIGTIGQPVDRERASIQMLAHFASLSVFSLRRRLGFLWRGCIVMMMMAINLVILEEGSMDMFQLLINASKESADIPALIPKTDNGNLGMQVYGQRRSSKVIALQLSALSNRSTEKVDGRAFLQCHPDYKPSWNDLDDFFECEEGKDYSNSLNRLEKFKTFKIKKYIIKKRRRGDILRKKFL